MRTAFAYCRDCPEITTGRCDTSKGFLLDASSNHHHCRVEPFGDVAALPAPIRNTIARLGASAPLGDNDITMLRLGLAMEDMWEPPQSTAPAAATTSPKSPAPVPPSDASTRSRSASTPTSITTATQPTLLDLLGSDS